MERKINIYYMDYRYYMRTYHEDECAEYDLDDFKYRMDNNHLTSYYYALVKENNEWKIYEMYCYVVQNRDANRWIPYEYVQMLMDGKSFERFLPVYGYNTKEWYVYDNIDDEYIVLPSVIDDELRYEELNYAQDMIEVLIKADGEWLYDDYYRFEADEI